MKQQLEGIINVPAANPLSESSGSVSSPPTAISVRKRASTSFSVLQNKAPDLQGPVFGDNDKSANAQLYFFALCLTDVPSNAASLENLVQSGIPCTTSPSLLRFGKDTKQIALEGRHLSSRNLTFFRTRRVTLNSYHDLKPFPRDMKKFSMPHLLLDVRAFSCVCPDCRGLFIFTSFY